MRVTVSYFSIIVNARLQDLATLSSPPPEKYLGTEQETYSHHHHQRNWHWTGDKPLNEPMMTRSIDTYMCHSASLSQQTVQGQKTWLCHHSSGFELTRYQLSQTFYQPCILDMLILSYSLWSWWHTYFAYKILFLISRKAEFLSFSRCIVIWNKNTSWVTTYLPGHQHCPFLDALLFEIKRHPGLPGHQQPWYDMIYRCLSYMREDFNFLHHISMTAILNQPLLGDNNQGCHLFTC